MRADERNFGLDVLRCVSIAVVLANHALAVVVIGLGGVPLAGRLAALSLFACESIEWLFVLSGFLIGGLLIRGFERGGSWAMQTRRFFLRRWLRTLPAYYLFVAVNAALAASGVGRGHFSSRFLWFGQNLVGPEARPLFFPEAWSLATDEWFYLLLPLLVGAGLWCLRGLRAAFVAATLALVLGPMIARALIAPPVGSEAWDLAIRRVTLYHLDATGWGVLAACLQRWAPAWWSSRRGAKLALGVLGCALGFTCYARDEVGGPLGAMWSACPPRLLDVVGITLVAAGTALALPAVCALPVRSTRLRAVVAAASDYSYAIYLCHLPVLLYLVSYQVTYARAAPGRFVLQWLLVVACIAAFVFHGLERPFHRLRDWLAPR